MPEQQDWKAALETGVSEFLQALLAYLPNLLAGVALLLVGWLIAHVLRAVTVRSTESVARWLPRLLPRALVGARWRVLSPRLLGGVVFWAVILVFLAAATQVIGLPLFAEWLDQAVGFIPVLLAAGLILVIGLVLSQLAREGVIAAAGDAEYRTLLGYGVQTAIVATVVVIGLELIGLDITLLVVVAAILMGAVAGGLALAFGLGARAQVANLLAARDLRQRYRPGDTIRVGDIEGQVLEVAPRAVVVETANGRVHVPAKLFDEHAATLLIAEQGDA